MPSELFSSPEQASLGSLNIPSHLPGPPLPNIVAEWGAILPLVTHLANQRDDYLTTGDVALMAALPVGLFPKLGIFSGYSRLLRNGTRFLDYASTRGGSSTTVWDVSWGSVFPCANGAASAAVMRYFLGRSKERREVMPEKLAAVPVEAKAQTASASHNDKSSSSRTASSTSHMSHFRTVDPVTPNKIPQRRYQVLNVFYFRRKSTARTLLGICIKLGDRTWFRVLSFIALLGLSAFLGLIGAYGTANKPMFLVPSGEGVDMAASWFWFANLVQLVAMTFVAGQKGWDGVALVLLLGLHWAVFNIFPRSGLVHSWLQTEGIDAVLKSYELGGRMAMMGAIQAFSKSKITRWMDDIIIPHPRRDALLSCIEGKAMFGPEFSESDQKRTQSMAEASLAAAQVLERDFHPSRVLPTPPKAVV
ncbi:hypothetical protein BN1708_011975 [Verticillium longisporum]|uniref:Uncharacterized protein n=1 Tax=Verticillium longisporum TaxID=100787 RepID=A0A0G4L5G2_VERLO|nr:hypothetical protein BN1708_011975 [Verticillium longisporum]